MRVYVCMYVYVYVCMYVCMYELMYECMNVCMYGTYIGIYRDIHILGIYIYSLALTPSDICGDFFLGDFFLFL